jgi:hypothetical protein
MLAGQQLPAKERHVDTQLVNLAAKRIRTIVFVILAGFAASAQTAQPGSNARPGPLPPQAEDPNRPAGLTQAPGRPNSWTDSQGRSYQRSSVGSWTNYDEAKANPYPLPDPLVLKNGEPVTDANTWWTRRRPEILEDLQREMYGRIPSGISPVVWEVTATDRAAAGGLAVKKTVLGRIGNSRYPSASPSIHITMYTPASTAAGPAPLMLVLVAGPGGYGAPRPGAPAPPPEPPAGSPLYQLLNLGWGYATLEVGPIQNDYAGGLTSGIIGLMNAGAPQKPDGWGALSAWAWGASRALDYLETDKSVDPGKVGIEGHSRYGKAALLAAALDRRWAIVYPSCSGEGGAKPSRRNWGETVDNLAGSHWMAANFRKYAGHWNDLPVDSNELIALVAPRPIFLNGGPQDQWADPHGAFLAAVAAGPVYRLLGKKTWAQPKCPNRMAR